jgi:2-dehydropantoate 2-reductase
MRRRATAGERTIFTGFTRADNRLIKARDCGERIRAAEGQHARMGRIAILGAGSVGCFVGGAWQAAGLDVSFIGRESIAGAVAGHGITLTDHSGWRVRLAPGEVDFTTRAAPALAKADIIALCVKSIGTAAAAKEIGRHAKKGATVISFQNGVSNVETLRGLLKRRFEIVQGMVPFNIAYLGQGRWHKGVSGDLVAGDTQATRALAERVGDRPGRLRLAGDMAGIAWGKLLINLNNAVNALSGRTLLEQLKERDYRRVVAASMVETLEILDAAGIEPVKIGAVPPRLLPHAIAAPDIIFNNLFLRVQKIDARARSSMYDDLAARRPTEIDYLNGEVVRLAEKLGRKAPVNSAIVALIKVAEAGVEHVWSPKELRRHVLEGHRAAPVFGY